MGYGECFFDVFKGICERKDLLLVKMEVLVVGKEEFFFVIFLFCLLYYFVVLFIGIVFLVLLYICL